MHLIESALPGLAFPLAVSGPAPRDGPRIGHLTSIIGDSSQFIESALPGLAFPLAVSGPASRDGPRIGHLTSIIGDSS